jgi:hypothetical protein
VNSFMLLKKIRVSKGFPTSLTCIGFLSIMKFYMSLEITGRKNFPMVSVQYESLLISDGNCDT